MKVMLAKKYEGQDPRGWWMSEKLDGVRAVWDGHKLTSRTGKEFAAPEWFIDRLPDDVVLDGELWEDRGMFQQTVGRVRAHSGDWSSIKFMVFDVVDESICEKRMNILDNIKLPEHCQVVRQVLCEGNDHLDEFESQVLGAGGEGVMIRRPKSLYDHRRSPDLLKVKSFQSDEAVVIGYTDGQGKHEGRIGALVCEYNEKVFNIGTGLSDLLREAPPEIGEVITFSFFEMTDGGVPRFPSFVTARDYE